MEKYDEYIESGVEWSGLIPSHWPLLPIRAIFEERIEKNDGPKTDFILSVTKDRGIIPYDEKGAIGNNKSEDVERYKLVYPGDFVINKMNVIIGSLGMSKYFGAFSLVYLVYKPRTSNIHIEYFAYIFSNESFYKSLIKYCLGIMALRESLNKLDFKKLRLPVPPIEDQIKITNFLDQKTAQIDRAIAQKERLIELLRERKQIVIQQAVTRGLDPTVKMKDSGVEWIGKVPEHWKISRIGSIFEQRKEKVSDKDFPPVSVTKNGVVPRLETAAKTIHGDDRKLVKKGDFAINSRSDRKGSSGVATQDGSTSLVYIVMVPSKVIYPDYCNYFLKSFSFVEENYRLGHGIVADLWTTGFQEMKKIFVAIPPYEEQIDICKSLAQGLLKINQSKKLHTLQIAKLKEYRTVLIDAAVTGKIKVSS